MTRIALLLLLCLCRPSLAFAQDVFCIDTANADNIIELVIENGQVRGATFSNEMDGSIGNRPLRPGEYSYNGRTVTYQGDTYNCQ